MTIQDPWDTFRREIADYVRHKVKMLAQDEKIRIHEQYRAELDRVALAALSRGHAEGLGVAGQAAHVSLPLREAKRSILEAFERDYFTALAAECGGSISAMARRAGTYRAHVRIYLRRHGIEAGLPCGGGRPPWATASMSTAAMDAVAGSSGERPS